VYIIYYESETVISVEVQQYMNGNIEIQIVFLSVVIGTFSHLSVVS